MIRKIIEIHTEKCNGCGLCARACHEGAIGMENGKAKLLREDYCDGLGDCLPACPTGAISFVEREAAAYDAAAVLAAKTGGCPGSKIRSMDQKAAATAVQPSQLRQWPVQIQLVPIHAPWLQDADLLVAADCTAYAYGNFHNDWMRDRITLVGCTKLDPVDYSIKLTEILRQNQIRSITVARMEVPCCGGMEFAVKKAIQNSGKAIPCRVVTIGIEGDILEDISGT